ncbi:MAG: beta-ketoacyl-ACP synthase II [Gemmatimonadetes bacterium]|nr:beta-ketoacyl-ACP synthase II [Gemmatimonadota bacterium]MCB9505702.1 beta-ketoacyl-ACP synthase II [Gemmatimonadales bacterium]HPF60779.1 beta-ketoacyl-ACP synthase II [Gemmatimonadales bacterium]HRX19216.1 beta-ketoacyl-ACP synthase II [Gemmatimonadales bacterium]
MRRRVVITGLGLVTPLGLTVDETWTNLLAGTSGAAPITKFDASRHQVRFACEVKGFDPLPYIDRKEARRFDLFAQYAIASAHQAVTQSGLDTAAVNHDRIGVVMGSGIGGMQTFEENCGLFLEKGPDRVSPFFVPMFIPNMAPGLVSMRYGFRGPNYAPVSACASSAHAIGESYRMIRDGLADAMISGGSEAAITGLTVAAFANMKAMSTRNDDPTAASRPFDADRDGFVLGDGGAAVVLEALEHAEARGATILGEVLGYGLSGDAYHMSAPAPEGEGAQRAMRMCLADGGIDPARVGYINAHGTSTPLGDIAETEAVKAVFGAHARNLVFGSTKSMTGHLLGGAGALEFVVTLLAARHGEIPPTINHQTPDPACDLDCAPNRSVRRSIDVGLSNAFGFGGHNAALAVRAA